MKTSGDRSLLVRRMVGVAFAAAMVAAPFVAFLYGVTAALGVMSFALAATTALALDAREHLTGRTRSRLLVVTTINAILALVFLALFIGRLI